MRSFNSSTFQNLFLATSLGLGLSACGGNTASSILNNIQLSNSSQNGDLYVQVSAEFNAGNLSFPLLTLPIAAPNSTSQSYGEIDIQRTLDNKNVLTAKINISKFSHAQGLLDPNNLPNGTTIPLAGVQGLVAVKAGNASRVYLGVSNQSKVLGIAVSIKEFDAIAQYVPGANLFFNIAPTSGTISGLVGIFTGAQSGSSGIALFVDATKYLSTSTSTTLVAQDVVQPSIAFKSGSNKSANKQAELERRVFNMSRQAQVLHFQ